MGLASLALLGFILDIMYPDNGTSRDENKDAFMQMVDPVGTLSGDVAEFAFDAAVYATQPDERHSLAHKPVAKRKQHLADRFEAFKTSGNMEAYNTLMESCRQQLFAIAKTPDGSPTDVDVLLVSGIDIDTQDEEGRTMLFYATSVKNPYLVGLLLNLGADRNIADNVGLKPMDLLDPQKDRAIYLSFHHKDVDEAYQAKGYSSLQATYTYDQDNNIVKTEVIGEQRATWSPLILAIEQGNTQQALAYVNADRYLFDQTSNGSTALFLAIKYKDDDVLNALLQRGADIQHRNRFNMNPLALAIKVDNLYAVRRLVEQGVDIRSVCASNRTPVNYADVNRRTEIKQYLKSIGAS